MLAGQVVWFTGLSGAGKSTLCQVIGNRVRSHISNLVFLDGDAVRAAVGDNLGHSETDRCKQIGRIQRFAKLLSDQGQIVLVCALYSHPDLLAWNRANFGNYFEVFVDAPFEVVRKRDVKGLYGGFAQGKISNVVGIDIPYHRPESPDLIVDTSGQCEPAVLADRIIDMVPYLRQV